MPPAPGARRCAHAREGFPGGAAALLALSLIPGCGKATIDLAGVRSRQEVDAGAADGAATRGSPEASAPSPPCASDADCTQGVCVLATGRCGECTSDTHCTSPLASHCDVTTNACVQCIVPTDCPVLPGGGSALLTCDPALLRCALGCTSSSGCSAFGLVCDVSRGACVQCQTAADCAQRPFRRPQDDKCVLGQCVQCVGNSDCPPTEPFCQQRGRCVECLQSEQCGPGETCDLRQTCQPTG